MENAKNVLGFIGLLFRADKIQIGANLWHHIDEMKLFIKAKDATSGEALRFEKKIKSRHLRLLEVDLTMAELGLAVGRDEVTYLGVTDKKAAMALLSKLH